MSAYMIEKPCSIFLDGTVVRYRKTGAVLELDDSVAAGLGDAVRKCGEPASTPTEVPPEAILTTTPDGQPATVVDDADSRRGRRPKPGGDDG